MQGYEYPTGHRNLEPGSWLCVVTDGVTEAMNLQSELYGSERLHAVLNELSGESPAAILAAVHDDVRRFAGSAEPSDDVTLLCVRWNGVAERGVPTGAEEEFADLDAAASGR